MAVDRGSTDNVSAVVVHLTSDQPIPPAAGRRFRLPPVTPMRHPTRQRWSTGTRSSKSWARARTPRPTRRSTPSRAGPWCSSRPTPTCSPIRPCSAASGARARSPGRSTTRTCSAASTWPRTAPSPTWCSSTSTARTCACAWGPMPGKVPVSLAVDWGRQLAVGHRLPPRQRHHPPRPQARERAGHRGRPAQGGRLRHRPARGGQAPDLEAPHRRRGHPQLHEPRADPGRAGRHPQRHLRLGDHHVRVPDRCRRPSAATTGWRSWPAT